MKNKKLIELHHGVWDHIAQVGIEDVRPYVKKFKMLDELTQHGTGFFIIVNLTTYKYEFLGRNQELITGYDNEYVKKEGVNFLTEHVHPEDGEYIVKKGYAKFAEILQQSEGEGRQNIVMHSNFRFRHKNGHLVHLVEQDQLLDMGDTENNNYMLTYVCETPPVDPFRGSIIIKKVDEDGKTRKILYEEGYPESTEDFTLSKRELDVVGLIARGAKQRRNR